MKRKHAPIEKDFKLKDGFYTEPGNAYNRPRIPKHTPNDRSEYDVAHDTRLFLRIVGIVILLIIALWFSCRYYDDQELNPSPFNPILEHSEITIQTLKTT